MRIVAILFAGLSMSIAQANLKPEIHGHRGTRGLLPENTLPAFRSALEAGVDYLELDLAVTQDGHLVVSHDPYINTAICLDPKGKRILDPPLIHSLSLAEIQKYDCGALRNSRFPRQKTIRNTPIPTLEEVFKLVRDSKHPNAKKVGFNIETKIFPDHPEYTVGPQDFAKKVVDAFEKSGFQDRIILQSFDPRTLAEAKKLNPKITRSLLIENNSQNWIEEAKKVNAQIVSPRFVLLSANSVTELHRAGFKVVPWTPNQVSEWKPLLEMKVDGIITDYPADLIQYLKKESQFISRVLF
jgi:glycerophosphoryl diester phosphodiesterase